MSPTTTGTVQCIGDVTATSNMAVALTDTAADAHAPVASFPDDDHVIVEARGVQRFPFTIISITLIHCSITHTHTLTDYISHRTLFTINMAAVKKKRKKKRIMSA